MIRAPCCDPSDVTLHCKRGEQMQLLLRYLCYKHENRRALHEQNSAFVKTTQARSTTSSRPLSIANQTHQVAGSTNCDVSEKLFRIKIFNDSPWIRSMSGRLHCPTSTSSTITAHLMPFGLFSPSEPRSMLPSIPSGAAYFESERLMPSYQMIDGL
ncbi:Beta-xylosidase [Trichinella spiralis]|uniref:Beta-xylosidase n=1 Tax=Trichinella spiralis TaxID=6334 RepID=A0ABR3KEY9_TRISP